MTGPEHYKEAERAISRGNKAPEEDAAIWFALAQAHATLAVAAATALVAHAGTWGVGSDD